MMRRLLSICTLVLVILCGMARVAFAESAVAEIPIAVTGGGTVVMTPKDDAPAPTSAELHFADEGQKSFFVKLTSPGTYVYTVSVKDEGVAGVTYDSTIYELEVWAYINDDGTLGARIVAHRDGSDEKYAGYEGTDSGTTSQSRALAFLNRHTASPHDDDPDSGGDDSGDTSGGGTSGGTSQVRQGEDAGSSGSTSSGTNSHPKTGDDSELEKYLLVSFGASAGLLAVSIIYAASTRRLARK